MTGLKLEDPTVDVGDIEKYRLAFLMQFFVQHRSRFRFPRLRLQDLYQRVIKDPEPTAFCDLVARILRFLNHGDPDICIDHVDQALDRFTVDKRTSYRIQMQRHRNGKPVHQLTAEARAALLENLIESVYDEQPDFNFTTTGFNNNTAAAAAASAATGASSGLSNGCRPSAHNGSSTADGPMSDADGSGSLFGGPNNLAGFPEGQLGDFGESDDENVLIIKAGQDAQGCSYYYMEDLRLYRERPQSGISSQWDVAVGPTASQWQAFIASLSRNEKEYDLYYFLQHELFELVKESLVRYDLQEVNDKLDTAYLRAKEASELSELRRLKAGGSGSTQTSGPSADDEAKFPVTSLGTNGPKSASPAFSGGHGGGVCGIGSAGSSTSGAPLTPSSSARTPTSAPPATSMLLSNGYLPPSATSADSTEAHGLGKTEANVFTTRPNCQSSWAADTTTALPGNSRSYSGQPNGEIVPGALASNATKSTDGSGDTRSPSLDPDSGSSVTGTATESAQSTVQTKPSPSSVLDPNTSAQDSGNLVCGDSTNLEPSHIERELAAAMMESHSKPSPTSGTDGSGTTTAWSSSGNRCSTGPSQRSNASSEARSIPSTKGLNGHLVEQSPFGPCPPSGVPSSVAEGTDSIAIARSSSSSQLALPTTGPSNPPNSTNTVKPAAYAFDSAARTKEMTSMGPTDPGSLRPNMVAVRPQGPVDHVSQAPVPPQPVDHHFPPGPVDCPGFGKAPVTKSHMSPATALVSPMVGIPDATLTQEQWENRKTKIAKLEKIQSTLNRSKSASTPGAVAAAAGAVLQQQRFQGGTGTVVPPPTSLAPSPGSLPPHGAGVNAPVGFGSPPYAGSQRPGVVDPYGGPRPVMMPGAPPSEMAQREWDRLCLDYQREKGEPPGPRFHPSCRSTVMYDPNGCPLMSTDPSTPPHGALPPGTMMMMPGQVMMDHNAGCGPNMRHFGPHVDGPGLGPPVVMVPPNNTNLTSANSGYPAPPSASGPMSAVPPGQHFRPMPASVGGYVCTDQSVPIGMIPPPGHKRPYHGPSAVANDPWTGSSGNHPMLSQVSMNETAMFPTGPMPPGQRMGPMTGCGIGSPPPMGGPGIPVSMSPCSVVTTAGGVTTISSTASSGRTGSSVGKAGGKKRKTTAAANRAAAAAAAAAATSNLNATNNASPAPGGLPQTATAYGKQPGLPGSMTPAKPSYPMPPYMVDNSGMPGLPPHSHRPPIYMSQSVVASHPQQQQSPGPLSHYPGGAPDPYFSHYPDMTGGAPPIGRPMGPAPPSGPEGRRALTPKGTDTFAMAGPNTGAGISSGRMPTSGCQVGFPTGPGGCANSSMVHPYLQSPECSVPTSADLASGMRSTGSYTTQHLTSASLASLARLSQMSGPEGPPYAPGSSASSSNAGPGGGPLSAPPTASGTTTYSGRGNPMLSYQQQQQSQPDGTNSGLAPPTSHQLPSPQLMRSHSMSACLKPHMNHEQPDQSSLGMNPPVMPSQSNPGMHPKFGAQGYHTQQSLPAGMLSTQSTTPMQQPQPPSIQVNNTFFNAQLNVQQMNYQHVSAPGSTGQMQIHFVQQQQQHQQQQQQQQPQPPPQQPVPPSHDQSPAAAGHRSARALDPNTRLSSACTTATAVSATSTMSSSSSSIAMNSSTTASTGQDYYQPDAGMMQHRFAPNYPNELSVKSDQLSCPALPTSNSGGAPPVSGYGNTSIQITPKTPHTIQYLPNPMTQNPTTDNSGSHNAQYAAAAAAAASSARSSRMNNPSTGTNSLSNNQSSQSAGGNRNCIGPPYQSEPDTDLTTASARQAASAAAASNNSLSFHPSHMYPGHHPLSQSQQQPYSQPGANLSPPTYHQTQPTSSMKMVPSQSQQQQQQAQQQHPSSRAPMPTGPWSGTESPFDPNHPGPMSTSFCSGMEPAYSIPPGGRLAGGPGHPSMKGMNTAPGGYPPNSLGFSTDPMVDHMPPGFMSDPMCMNRGPSAGGGHSAPYGRPQSSGRHPSYDQGPPPQQQQQQQHVYRQQQQQQYNHTQTSQQQQQQQHQMFMSSSNYISEGPSGPSGGQVQFVMSASSSAAMSSSSSTSTSCSSASTMQASNNQNNNCSTGLINQDNTMVNQAGGANQQDGKSGNYDHSKRSHMMMMTTAAPGSDDMKPGQMATVFNSPAGSQQQHMMMQSQLGPGRTSGARPLSNTGNPNPMGTMDSHFGGGGGGGPYHHPSGGAFIGGSNFSQSMGSMSMGGGYGTDSKTSNTGGRELMSASQPTAAMCDVSSVTAAGLAQVTYQSPMIQ